MSDEAGPPPWRVWFTSRTAARAADVNIESWLDRRGTPDGRPFLIGPDGIYDPDLNAYFEALPFVSFAEDTQEAVPRDLARFLTFVHWSRRGGSVRSDDAWRSVTPDDRAAYYEWRNVSASGPRVSASTWNREVATVSGFYQWAVSRGLVDHSPIATRESRAESRSHGRKAKAQVAAEMRPDRRGGALEWLPADEYRQWRDVGLRGYTPNGTRDTTFRGTLAGRNAAYADLMVRTGLRLSEQSALLVSEIPGRAAGSRYRKFWLPEAIAKNGSARYIYVPDQALGSIAAYLAERQLFIRDARARGTYARIQDVIVTDTQQQVATDSRGNRVEVSSLTVRERRRLYVDGSEGLEPAMLWLGQSGLPLSSNSWQNVFSSANRRCARHGVMLRCHPHALRHTYAVRTLDQLQRGHLAALGGHTAAQRRHYSMVFGDPLNWLRVRLGHKSVETTMIYLHTLSELEFETRLALTAEEDEWDIPADVATQ